MTINFKFKNNNDMHDFFEVHLTNTEDLDLTSTRLDNSNNAISVETTNSTDSLKKLTNLAKKVFFADVDEK